MIMIECTIRAYLSLHPITIDSRSSLQQKGKHYEFKVSTFATFSGRFTHR